MTLVFLHIDKTGGMSVREWLARQFPPEEIRPVIHHPQASWQTDAYPTVHQDLFVANASFRHDPAHKLVMGHYDWSIVPKIPGALVVTMVREPVARAASLWRFVCKERAMFGAASERAETLGFDRWVRMYSGTYANQMTAQLAGCRWSAPAEVNAELFTQAARNLRQCALVGLFECLDESLERLRSLAGVDGPADWPHVNATADRFVVADDTAAFIRQASRFDVELYELVRWKYAL